MKIREATEDDLPAIVDLFKVALGEQGGVPSIEFWKWKHFQNPFGPSPTLLAWVDERLVGLRTFLRWRFRYQGESFLAFRAVDTATHSKYRGQGIFSKLTLGIIDKVKTGEESIIFNTPNQMSRPGYIKMGWKILGKTPLVVCPFPSSLIYNRFVRPERKAAVVGWPTWFPDRWPEIEKGYLRAFHNQVTTEISMNYLEWRYRKVPDIPYNFHACQGGNDLCVIFYRLKAGRLVELRIADVYFSQPNSSLVSRCIREAAEVHKPDFITLLDDADRLLTNLLPNSFIRLKRWGLTMAYRHVNSDVLTQLISDQKRWYVSAGTIELF